MNKTKEKKIEFIAKTVTDIGKAIFIEVRNNGNDDCCNNYSHRCSIDSSF